MNKISSWDSSEIHMEPVNHINIALKWRSVDGTRGCLSNNKMVQLKPHLNILKLVSSKVPNKIFKRLEAGLMLGYWWVNNYTEFNSTSTQHRVPDVSLPCETLFIVSPTTNLWLSFIHTAIGITYNKCWYCTPVTFN